MTPDDLGELGDHDHHAAAHRGRVGDRGDAEGEGPDDPPRSASCSRARRSCWPSRSRSASTTTANRACSSSSNVHGSRPSAPATTWASTASRLPLYVLTFLLSFLCAIYTWRYVPNPGRTKAFLALMLLLETGMAGTFIAFDLILFFVFWEMVLVPMYFLIGIWGSRTASTPRSSSSCTRCSGRCSCCWASWRCTSSGPEPAHLRHDRAARLRCGRGLHPDVPADRVRRGGARASR